MFVAISKVFLVAVVLATGLSSAQVTCTGTLTYEPAGGQGMPLTFAPAYYDTVNLTPYYTNTYLRKGQQFTVYEAVQKPDFGGEIWYRIGTNLYVQGFGAGWFRMVTLNPGCPMP